MTTTTTLPEFIPCPFPGLPGARFSDGSCTYMAELMTYYWRCPIHGTVPWSLSPRPWR
jgi:hypothetical protein